MKQTWPKYSQQCTRTCWISEYGTRSLASTWWGWVVRDGRVRAFLWGRLLLSTANFALKLKPQCFLICNFKNEKASKTNAMLCWPRIPVLPSFVHIFMLLHHDWVSCWHINNNSDWEEKNNQFSKSPKALYSGRAMLSWPHLWTCEKVSYWAVFVRMDVRSACSSVRADGTLVFIQSAPLGGLLMGLGWGSSGLRSSEPWNRWEHTSSKLSNS